jgi:Cu+-exporting ATPase
MTTTMAKDPVCGMEVDPLRAADTSVYQGKVFYFCAAGCKQAFDQDPQRYVGQQTTA